MHLGNSFEIYVGAENILSPLGKTAKENFDSCLNNLTGIKQVQNMGINGEALWASKLNDFVFEEFENQPGILQWLLYSINKSLRDTSIDIRNERVALLLSSTKGNLEAIETRDANNARIGMLLESVKHNIGFSGFATVISTACISGTLSLILAHDLISTGRFDHVIVTGADILSRFTSLGFQSLHALSDEPCRPFCKTRKGVSLGEGAATIIVSKEPAVFNNAAFRFLGGTTSNDANHISGPSQTGEGLYRAVRNCLINNALNASDIDFISAHGTGTVFNDDMESVAFNRADLSAVPVNSMKGYFGHTFGAAGLIESAMCLQSFRNDVILKSAGIVEPGTVEVLNVVTDHLSKDLKTILKTASGFGGCNAALILQEN